MTYRQSRFTVIVCLMLTALFVVGCSQSPQEKYNDAMSKLSDAKKDRDKAKDKVKDARQQVQDDQDKLDKAQAKLDKANQKVASANQAVDKVVNDDVLFRTLQKKLLDDDTFSDSAISVGVSHRVVTLTGTVPDQDTRKRATKVVRNQAGVASVNNQLQVTKDDDKSDHSIGKTQDDAGGNPDGQPAGPNPDQNQPPQGQSQGGDAGQNGGQTQATPDQPQPPMSQGQAQSSPSQDNGGNADQNDSTNDN